MEKAVQISDLLYKKIKGQLSFEEEKQLQQWVDQNEANVTFYKKMLEDHTLIEKLDDFELFDKTAAWSSIEKNLYKTKVININASIVLRYAAVLVPFILLMSAGYYWWDQEYNSLAKIDETFSPWESKATLILANGEKLDLQKETVTMLKEGGAQLQNQEKTLSWFSLKVVIPLF